MYVTRPLSLLRKHPHSLSMDPPEGPYTGYLVITDEEAESQDSWCCGIRKDRKVKKLPFPQDKILSVFHDMSDYGRDHELTMKVRKVWFVPVLDRPLSSNCYYVIKSHGRSHKGQAYRSSRESDMGLCCFEGVIKDKKPKPFDYTNVYHQFKVHRHHQNSFFAKSLALDGLPPRFLMRRGWKLRSSRSKKRLHLTEALGLDAQFRSHVPRVDNFPIYSRTSPPEVVGKWYCPFMFIKEGALSVKEQMRFSRVYRVSLEKYWQEIYSCSNTAFGNDDDDTSTEVVGAVVSFRVAVGRRADVVFGREAAMVVRHGDGHHGMVLFRSKMDKRVVVGLSVAVVKKMEWVMEEGGWLHDDQRVVRVEEEVEIGNNGWRRFSCYVLVESFVFRRMDGTVVLKSDFRHTNNIKWRWD